MVLLLSPASLCDIACLWRDYLGTEEAVLPTSENSLPHLQQRNGRVSFGASRPTDGRS